MDEKTLEHFRRYRENPAEYPQVKVRQALGMGRTDTQNFYRLFHKAWKIDLMNRDVWNAPDVART